VSTLGLLYSLVRTHEPNSEVEVLLRHFSVDRASLLGRLDEMGIKLSSTSPSPLRDYPHSKPTQRRFWSLRRSWRRKQELETPRRRPTDWFIFLTCSAV